MQLTDHKRYREFVHAIPAVGKTQQDTEQLLSEIHAKLRYNNDYAWVSDVAKTTTAYIEWLRKAQHPNCEELIDELQLTVRNLKICPQTVWIHAKTNKYDSFKSILLDYMMREAVKEGTKRWLNT